MRKFLIVVVLTNSAKISFSTFKQSFASTTNFLKRRFSSGDLSGESIDDEQPLDNAKAAHQATRVDQSVPQSASHPVSQTSDLSLNFRGSNTTSAPTSPQFNKSVSSFLSRATSLTGSVTSTVQQLARAPNKDRQKILLVIDDHQTDWSKYFRGKRLPGDWDIRVEQAEFRDLTLTANSELGTVASIITVDRNGAKIARTFRPDFVLIRQHIRDFNEDHRDILLGLKYGNVPCINSLHCLYNFQDRPWVFSHLIGIQRRVGKENFPLIEQTFYPNHREMATATRFPCVVKIGHSHSGQGKMKVENMQDFYDLSSVFAVTNTYCTVEPFIDAKCDIHIQKIGNNYKAYLRKSISGNWKANIGSAMLEQITVSEKYKKWVDDVAEVFGGLDICAIEAIIGKDGKEHIIEVTGSAMTLLGESQEEDRRAIADLVAQKMHFYCRPAVMKQQSRASVTDDQPSDQQQSQISGSPRVPLLNQQTSQPSHRAQALPSQQQQQQQQRRGSRDQVEANSISGVMTGNPHSLAHTQPQLQPQTQSQPQTMGAITSQTISQQQVTAHVDASHAAQQQQQQQHPTRPALFRRSSQTSNEESKVDEVDDTMRNLRKTFAGIFGDM